MIIYKIANNNKHFDGIAEMMEGVISPDFTYMEPPKPYTDYLFNGIKWVLISSLPVQEIGFNLPALISNAKLSIDKKAEEVRASHVTAGLLQQTIYNAKLAEAKAYIAASYPSTATKKKSFPLIQQESLLTKNSMKLTADTIVSTYNSWMITAGKIEGIRLKAKTDISVLTDPTSIQTIADAAINNLQILM